MDKNDFDVDFDFEKDMGFDPEEFLNSDDPGEFDLSQFDDEDLGGEEQPKDQKPQEDFQDFELDDQELTPEDYENYDLDQQEFAQEDEFDPYAQDDGAPQDEGDYAEGDDFGEDLYFPRRERREPEEGQEDHQWRPAGPFRP